jgi:hypothetical protein
MDKLRCYIRYFKDRWKIEFYYLQDKLVFDYKQIGSKIGIGFTRPFSSLADDARRVLKGAEVNGWRIYRTNKKTREKIAQLIAAEEL